MTPVTATIEIQQTDVKYCQKEKLDNRTLQNTFKSLEKSGLLDNS